MERTNLVFGKFYGKKFAVIFKIDDFGLIFGLRAFGFGFRFTAI